MILTAGNRIPLYDGQGFVEFRKASGDDAEIREAACVSFDGFDEREHKKDVKSFIKMLLNKGHTSPFEHVGLTLKIKAPIFVLAQFKRYRHASFIERSNRYSTVRPEFYVPKEWRARGDRKLTEHEIEWINVRYAEYLESFFEQYDRAISFGVKKELARILSPVSNMTELYWTGNLRSILHILDERLKPETQLETRELAQALESVARLAFPETFAAVDELSWFERGKDWFKCKI